MIWIRSHHLHLQWIYKLLAGNFTWGNKAKQSWVMSTNFLLSKVCWQSLPMFCLYTSSKLSQPIIWIFTEGDGIESRLPFKIFYTLHYLRYTAICRPMQASIQSGKKKTLVTIVVIWIICLVPSFMWTRYINVSHNMFFHSAIE